MAKCCRTKYRLNSTKGLCCGGFWKPWGWWKSRRGLCCHLRRKKVEEIRASNGNLHLYVTNAGTKKPQYNELTKNTYDDLSLLKPGQINILKDLQSISKLSYVKIPSTNRKTVSRSLHIFAETKQSTNFKHYMNSDASTCISMHRHASACNIMIQH